MTSRYPLGAPVMLQLGAYQFGLNTAAFQGLQRSDDYRWPEQGRLGREAALQFVGPGATTINLDGVIYPEWRGGTGQLDAMRAEAGKGRPLVLVDGLGKAHGMWVIERIDETQGTFAAGGVARRIEFTMQLKRYSAKVTGPVPKLPPLPVPPPPIPLSADTPAAKTAALAASIGTQAKDAATTSSGAYARLQARLTPAATWLKEAAGGAKRAVDVARDIHATTTEATTMLAQLTGSSRVLSITRTLGARAEQLGLRAQSAERLLRRSAGHIEASQDENTRAVLAALEGAGKTSMLARTLAVQARKIIEEANTVKGPRA